MSWKAVEMQIALPRTQDASQLQEQLQQRGQNMQSQLTQEQLRELERKRKAVLEANQRDDVHVKDHDDERDQLPFHKRRNNHKQHEESSEWNHPHLGNRVDFSG
ncbi:hypothetical protein [Alkalibacillus aidingensis]|uniref:hypothetical protein n=1 Tax=Alkalibacillus aidingensis TaxID=2747607 RepID=UPI0016609721|nr:hypothetical protein [Alkalibacillus aidingensis]